MPSGGQCWSPVPAMCAGRWTACWMKSNHFYRDALLNASLLPCLGSLQKFICCFFGKRKIPDQERIVSVTWRIILNKYRNASVVLSCCPLATWPLGLPLISSTLWWWWRCWDVGSEGRKHGDSCSHHPCHLFCVVLECHSVSLATLWCNAVVMYVTNLYIV